MRKTTKEKVIKKYGAHVSKIQGTPKTWKKTSMFHDQSEEIINFYMSSMRKEMTHKTKSPSKSELEKVQKNLKEK